jgi:hypothetical protein
MTAETPRKMHYEVAGFAAVRNREKASVLSALLSGLYGSPELPGLPDIAAGEFRTNDSYIEVEGSDVYMRDLQDGGRQDLGPATLMRLRFAAIREAYRAGGGTGPDEQEWRYGPSTAKAWLTRDLETVVDRIRILEQIESTESSALAELDRLSESITSKDDPSYQFANSDKGLVNLISFYFRDSAVWHLAATSIRIIQRYPDFAELPDSLAQDFTTPGTFDPGSSYRYRKTASGFILYSVGEDGIDNDLVIPERYLRREFVIGRMGSDLGVVVNYQ